MRKALWVAVGAALLAGCSADPITRKASDNGQIAVDHLLTIDGGNSRYVTICPDARRTSTSGDDVKSNGKTTTVTPWQIEAVRSPRPTDTEGR